MMILLIMSGTLSAQTVDSAQIIVSFQVKKVGCNGSSLGSASITVNTTNYPYPPYTYLWSDGQTTSTANDLSAGTYSVIVTDNLGNDTTMNVSVTEFECDLGPDPIFTPNGDGINDTWFINDWEFFPNALILVYNRWGQKVYEHKGLYSESWNGNDLIGSPVPDGSYYYIVYKDKDDHKTLQKACVSILR